MTELDNLRIILALKEEVGYRVMLNFQTRKRDLRWFRGLQWRRYHR